VDEHVEVVREVSHKGRIKRVVSGFVEISRATAFQVHADWVVVRS
jgi:hypothetical protein